MERPGCGPSLLRFALHVNAIVDQSERALFEKSLSKLIGTAGVKSL